MISGVRLLPASRPCRGRSALALSAGNPQPNEPVQRSEKEKMIAGVVWSVFNETALPLLLLCCRRTLRRRCCRRHNRSFTCPAQQWCS